MSKILNIILLFAVFQLNALIAEEFDARIRLSLDNTTSFVDNLIFGASSFATDSLDRSLGEAEIPPMPPPEFDLFAAFNWDTTDVSGRWSYVDLRSIYDEDVFFHRYRLIIFKRVNSIVKIIWDDLPPFIESATITDRLGGLIFSADMKSVNEVTINNQTLEKLDAIINVTYNKNNVEENTNDDLRVYPNPVTDYFSVNNTEIDKIEIFDIYGKQATYYDNFQSQNKYDMSFVSHGTYIIKITKTDNTVHFKKIVKMK